MKVLLYLSWARVPLPLLCMTQAEPTDGAVTDATASEKPVLLGNIAGKGCEFTLLSGSSNLSPLISCQRFSFLNDEHPPEVGRGWRWRFASVCISTCFFLFNKQWLVLMTVSWQSLLSWASCSIVRGGMESKIQASHNKEDQDGPQLKEVVCRAVCEKKKIRSCNISH